MGIISLIDDESRFPKGTDDTLLQKLHTQHDKHPYYELPKKTRTTAFCVKHFAGKSFLIQVVNM